ncbi:MAG: outer membrane beta-barrel domain-containing protein [Proteobacteria bacterium]|nr:outer membrane beta-barrel domain-containing protein [Pseudomonadota bacterium]
MKNFLKAELGILLLSSSLFAATDKKADQKKTDDTKAVAASKAVPEEKKPDAKDNKNAVETKDETRSDAVKFSANDVWKVDLFERDDHKVLVIQDRKYNKAKRLQLGIDGGKTAASPFHTTYTYGGHAAYHFTEYLGMEGYFSNNKNSLNKHGKQINDFLSSRNFASKKEFREPKWYTGLAFTWSPIYGKFAFFRSSIIHYDFYGVFGASYFQTNSNYTPAEGGKNQKHLGSLVGVGARVFLNKNWTWRFDVRNSFYQAQFAPTSASGTGSKVWLSYYQFTTGISYLFNLGGF